MFSHILINYLPIELRRFGISEFIVYFAMFWLHMIRCVDADLIRNSILLLEIVSNFLRHKRFLLESRIFLLHKAFCGGNVLFGHFFGNKVLVLRIVAHPVLFICIIFNFAAWYSTYSHLNCVAFLFTQSLFDLFLQFSQLLFNFRVFNCESTLGSSKKLESFPHFLLSFF